MSTRLWFLALSASVVSCAHYTAQPLTSAGVQKSLRFPARHRLAIAAREVAHPLLQPVRLDFRHGLGPDQVAVLAVIANPALRADRDRRGLAAAQTFSAGVLPNPTLGYARDFVTGGHTLGTVTAYGFTGSWDVSSVVSRNAKVRAAKKSAQAIELDVAWIEWQAAEAARLAWYRVMALHAQAQEARLIDADQQQAVGLLQQAVNERQKSALDLAAAQATGTDARATYLSLQQDLAKQTLALNRAVGAPPQTVLPLPAEANLSASLRVPDAGALISALEHRRLDLLGLRVGYESQDAKLRAAVLAQLPKVNLGFSHASDTSNVHTTGLSFSFDLPIFDRNQGSIAVEKATRQSLYDEYTNRLFQARADVAEATADLRSLNVQVAAAAAALPALARLLETAQAALQGQNADVLAYYQARANYNQKRIQLLKLKQQLHEARVALELAAGCFLPDQEGGA
ncbi:MAG TPA: TolC family protein [Chthoniobacterales bacterium]